MDSMDTAPSGPTFNRASAPGPSPQKEFVQTMDRLCKQATPEWHVWEV